MFTSFTQILSICMERHLTVFFMVRLYVLSTAICFGFQHYISDIAQRL